MENRPETAHEIAARDFLQSADQDQLTRIQHLARDSKEQTARDGVEKWQVDYLLQVRELSHDHDLAASRRTVQPISVSELPHVKKMTSLVRSLRHKDWKKKAELGPAETLITAGRDRELCNMIEKDMAMSSASIASPSLLWCSAPTNSARLKPPKDSVLAVNEMESQRGKHYEKRNRVLFTTHRDRGQTDTNGQEGETIAMQTSPWLAAGIAEPERRENSARVRNTWASASGIGSLGTIFGAANSLFVAEQTKQITTATWSDDPRQGIRTVSPSVFGLVSITSRPETSANSSIGIRDAVRTPKLQDPHSVLEQTAPRLRSPRQHQMQRNRLASGFAASRSVNPPTSLQIESPPLPASPAAQSKLPLLPSERVRSLRPLTNSLPCLITTPESTLMSPRRPHPPIMATQDLNKSARVSPGFAAEVDHLAVEADLVLDHQSLIHTLSGSLVSEPGRGAPLADDQQKKYVANVLTVISPSPPQTPSSSFEGGLPVQELMSVHPSEAGPSNPNTPRPLTGHSATSIPRQTSSRGSIRTPRLSPDPADGTKGEHLASPVRPSSTRRPTAPNTPSRPASSRPEVSSRPASSSTNRIASRGSTGMSRMPSARSRSGRTQRSVEQGPAQVPELDRFQTFFDSHEKEYLCRVEVVDALPDQTAAAGAWIPTGLHWVEGLYFLAGEGGVRQFCHCDDVFILQERATTLRSFALDITIEEQWAVFKDKHRARFANSTIRFQAGDRVQVFRATEDAKCMVEFSGNKGFVPVDTLELQKPVARALTVAFASREERETCVAALQHRSPLARTQCEPRAALYDTLASENRLAPTTATVRGRRVLLRQVRDASAELQRGYTVISNAENTIQVQLEKAFALGKPKSALKLELPQREKLAESPRGKQQRKPSRPRTGQADLAASSGSSPRSAPSTHRAGSTPRSGMEGVEAARQRGKTPSSTPTNDTKPSSAGSAHVGTIMIPTQSPRQSSSRQSSRQSSRRSNRSGSTLEMCRDCERHAHVTKSTKKCSDCLLTDIAVSLNAGDLASATTADGQVSMLLGHETSDVQGEKGKLHKRHAELQERIANATKLDLDAKFFAAAQAGDVQAMFELVNHYGVNPAVQVGEVEWVDKKGFLKSRQAFVGFTAVHFAVMPTSFLEKGDKVACLRYLIEHLGVYPHTKSQDMRTAMHVSVCESPCLRYLIEERGGNANLLDSDGRTVLHHAALYGKIECLIYLIAEEVVDPATSDKFGKRAADYEPIVAGYVKRSKSLKRVINFWRGAIVMKCFVRWAGYKRDPAEENQPKPSLEERRVVRLPQPSARMRMYKEWYKNGTPFTLAKESAASVDHESPAPFRGAGTTIALFNPFSGSNADFKKSVDTSVENEALTRSVNTSMAVQGLRLSMSTLEVHFDAERTLQSARTGRFLCLPASGKWKSPRQKYLGVETPRSTGLGLFFESDKFTLGTPLPSPLRHSRDRSSQSPQNKLLGQHSKLGSMKSDGIEEEDTDEERAPNETEETDRAQGAATYEAGLVRTQRLGAMCRGMQFFSFEGQLREWNLSTAEHWEPVECAIASVPAGLFSDLMHQ